MSDTHQLSLFDAPAPPPEPSPAPEPDDDAIEPQGELRPPAPADAAPLAVGELFRPPSGTKGRIDANVEALGVLADLAASGASPTPDQRRALGRWSGWGAVAGVFDPNNAALGDRHDAVRAALADEAAYDAAARSVLNAHYTAPAVAEAMWDWTAKAGLAGGRAVEIGCGAGMFLVSAPQRWKMTGIEADPTTAAIAAHLAPHAQVEAVAVQHWQPAEDRPYDLMIGNVPFSSARPFDRTYARTRSLSLHNYCLLRGLAALRPGGLLISVTSMYTMDALNSAQRQQLSRWGEFVGAIRLPGGAFRANAGTDATTDIVVMTRRAEPAKSLADVSLTAPEELWLSAVEHDDFRISGWYHEHPELMLGELAASKLYSSDGHALVERGGADLAADLVAAFGSEPMTAAADTVRSRRGIAPAPKRLGNAATAPADQRVRQVTDDDAAGRATEGTIIAEGMRFLVVRDGWLVPFRLPTARRDVNPSAGELRALLRLRDAALRLLDAELDGADDDDVEALRAALNAAYDEYRALGCGRLSRRPLNAAGKPRPFQMSGFRSDPHYELVRSLEDPALIAAGAEDVRGPLMRRRTIRVAAHAETQNVSTVADAVALSMWRTGAVWPDMVSELLGRDVGPDELAPAAFWDPEAKEWQSAAQYLAGDVVSKLEAAQAANDAGEAMDRNIEALTGAVPEPVAPEDISIELGSPLVTSAEVQQFANQTLQGRHLRNPAVEVVCPADEWDVRLKGVISKAKSQEEWGTERVPANRVLRKLLNREPLLVYHPAEKGEKRVVDKMATLELTQVAERWQQAFVSWCFVDDLDRADDFAARYNRIYNSRVVPKYPAWIRPPGMSEDFDLREHQAQAVTRIILTRSALLGHEVGLGKTATMAAAAMELRRLGLANRPMAVVPLQLVSQFAADFLRIFPAARLLVCDPPPGGGAAYRSRFAAQCATGDWDCVIISYTQFAQLPVSIRHSVAEEAEWLAELMRRHDADAAASAAEHARSANRSQLRADIDRQTTRLRKALRQFAPKEARKKDPLKNHSAAQVLDVAQKTVKQAERDHLSREEAARERVGEYDGEISFEDLGIDFLVVDEADSFKNAEIRTKDRLILEGGRAPTGSMRARDLDRKLKWLESTSGESRVVLATGTPVANKLVELWVMQRYVQRPLLEALGLDRIEAWVAMFGVGVTAPEVSPTGEWRMKERLAGFANLPELLSILGQNIELLTYEQVGLSRPEIAGGDARIIEIAPTDGNEEFLAELAEREARVQGGVDPTVDNMLSISTAARAAAIDLRLVGRHQDEGGKIDRVADEVAAIWEQSRDNRYEADPGVPHPIPGALQMVFLDLGTPGGVSVNLYQDLRNRLVERDMDPARIRFFHDRGTSAADKDDFDQECRTGGVDVLIASTEKAGAGLNVQDRMIALHHVNPPWRPRDVQQREGRAIRQGNQHDSVEIVRYVTRRTFDAFSWQVLARKAGFISQLMSHAGGRRIDDLDTDIRDSFNATMAIASGDPRLIEEIELTDDVRKLRDKQRAHQSRQGRIRRGIENAEYQVDVLNARIDTLEDLKEQWADNTAGDHKPEWSVGLRPTDDPAASLVQQAASVMHRQYSGHSKIGDIGISMIPAAGGVEVFVGPTTAGLKFWVHRDDLDSVDIPRRVTARLHQLDASIERCEKNRDIYLTEIEDLQQLNSPAWPHEDELAAKAAQLAELSYAIRADADPDIARSGEHDGVSVEDDEGSGRVKSPSISR